MRNSVIFHVATDEALAKYYESHPVSASSIGIHKHDILLADLSKAGVERDFLAAREYLHTIDKLSIPRLDPEDRIDYRLARAWAQMRILEHEQIRPHERQPAWAVDDSLYGCFLLMCRPFPGILDRATALLARIRAIPDTLRDAAALHRSAPGPFCQSALESIDGGLEFFASTVPAFGKQFKNKQYQDALQTASSAAMVSLQNYREHIERELLPSAGDDVAIGKEVFDYWLKAGHLLDEDSEQLLEFGLESVQSTLAALEAEARALSPDSHWQQIVDQTKADHPAAGELLDYYRSEMERAKQFLIDRDLVSIPENQTLGVVNTPAFQRAVLPYAAYMPSAAFDPQQQGYMWVTPVDLSLPEDEQQAILKGHARIRVGIIALHEAYPGHHLQFSLANQHPSIYRRHFGQSNVFCEGWALYCEQMMLEEGFFSDPRTRIVQLAAQLWRACRVVIDVRLHTRVWTPAECVDYLVEVARLERANAECEVRRYCANPTQPMTYLLGKSQLLETKEQARKRLGDRFTLKGFHDDLLSHGTIPFRLIRESMFRVE